MGDRSWGEFEVPAQYEDQIEELVGGFEDCNLADGKFTFWQSDMNGGGWSEAESLREAGIPYHWEWSECGGCYDAGRQVWVPALGAEELGPLAGVAGPVARVNEDGTVPQEDINNATEYYRVLKLFNQHVEQSMFAVQCIENAEAMGALEYATGA